MSRKHPRMNLVKNTGTGSDRERVIRPNFCRECDTPIDLEDFRDLKSRDEYRITGLCQKCQTKMWNYCDEDFDQDFEHDDYGARYEE